ncbi:MAG: hypothetical protein GEU80_01825 [Dehalococcoidia bacterium]|nr:hypothetical protein [Dehalococcoidia bacterium]
MTEFAVLLLFVAAVAAFVLWPTPPAEAGPTVDDLRVEHDQLLDELRELDEDAAAGRISPDDRRDGRRALGGRLRTVTEALRERGETAGQRG